MEYIIVRARNDSLAVREKIIVQINENLHARIFAPWKLGFSGEHDASNK